jgi:hypothetical protein
MAIPTVHDRGLGYSNRFTLCRGCTLYPQSSGYSLCGHLPRITSYAMTSTRSKPFAYLPYYGNLPYGVSTSTAHPGSLPPRSSVTPVPRQETHSVFRRLGICHDMCFLLPKDNPDSGAPRTLIQL